MYYTCIIRPTTCDKFLPSFCLVFAVITGMYAYHLEYHYLITTLIVFACGPLIKFYSIALWVFAHLIKTKGEQAPQPHRGQQIIKSLWILFPHQGVHCPGTRTLLYFIIIKNKTWRRPAKIEPSIFDSTITAKYWHRLWFKLKSTFYPVDPDMNESLFIDSQNSSSFSTLSCPWTL